MAVLTKITQRSLADNAVTSAHVQGDVIAAGDLAPNSVTASELADNAVDTAAIATDAVTNVKVADGAIDHPDKLASSVVTTAKIADSSSTTTAVVFRSRCTGDLTDPKSILIADHTICINEYNNIYFTRARTHVKYMFLYASEVGGSETAVRQPPP